MRSRHVRAIIFEDEEDVFRLLCEAISAGGIGDDLQVLWSPDGEELFNEDGSFLDTLKDDHLKESSVDLLAVDLKMPPTTSEFESFGGMVVLERIFSIPQHCRTVIVTSQWTDALRNEYPGIYKEFSRLADAHDLIVIDKEADGAERSSLLRQIVRSRRGRRILSPQVERQILFLGRTNDPVLILGESGSGKEGIARAVHRDWCQHHHSGEERGFFSLNAGALRYELMRAELFGYAEGAYTGAAAGGAAGVALQACGVSDWKDVEGRRALDDSSAFQHTLFFDEIGNLQRPEQGLLLRFLEDPFAAAPLGHAEIHNVRPRIIAATNSDQWMKMAMGERGAGVHSDLFERVGRHIIWVPRLTPEDVNGIVRMVSTVEWSTTAIEQVTELVRTSAVRGNIRGLINFIKRAELIVGEGADLGWAFGKVTGRVVDLTLSLARPASPLDFAAIGPVPESAFVTPNGNTVTEDQVALALEYATSREGEEAKTKDSPGQLVRRYGEAKAELILLCWFAVYSETRKPKGQKLEAFRHAGARRWFASASEAKAHRSVQEAAKSILRLETVREVAAKAQEFRQWCQLRGVWPAQLV